MVEEEGKDGEMHEGKRLTLVKKEVWSEYHWKDYKTVHQEAEWIGKAIHGKELYAEVEEDDQTHSHISSAEFNS